MCVCVCSDNNGGVTMTIRRSHKWGENDVGLRGNRQKMCNKHTHTSCSEIPFSSEIQIFPFQSVYENRIRFADRQASQSLL